MSDADRIAQLEADNAWLRSELGLSIRAGQVHALCRELKVTRAHAYILLALKAAGDRGLTIEQLDDRVPVSQGRPREGFTVRVFIYQIRRRLGREAIDSMAGGYRLSATGAALLDPVLQLRRAA